MHRLSWSSLKSIKHHVLVPKYDRPSKDESNIICHIGVGGFHRSHQAVYCDDILTSVRTSPRWWICGIGLLDDDKKMSEALLSQECLYTVLTQGTETEEVRVIGSIIAYIWAHTEAGLKRALDEIASPRTRILSLTITEKGYCQSPKNSRKLNLQHPQIKHDLENPDRPETAIGLIVAGLKVRKNAEIPPFTVLSCDNLQENGDMLRSLVLEFASKTEPSLADWIERNVSFPNSMVDRITPITEKQHREYLRQKYKLIDNWPVVCEPFRQWVIEDNFCNGRPQWEAVGVQLVKDVKPYELMKIRLLNGSHSALAYVSYLVGYRYVSEALENEHLLQFVKEYMNEVAHSIQPVKQMSLEQYQSILIERFRNPKIRDTVQRLALDGSSKCLNSWEGPILDLCAKKIPIQNLAFTIATWIRYMTGFDEDNTVIPIDDPMRELLVPVAANIVLGPSGTRDPKPFLQLVMPNVTAHESFCKEVQTSLEAICDYGCKQVLAARYELL